jgi:hypothetical protein
MIYKTLFQKLDSDVLIKMYNEQSEYPNLIGEILEQLNQLIDVEDLSLRYAIFIFNYSTEKYNAFNINDFIKLFK